MKDELDDACERDIYLPAFLAGSCLIGGISVGLVAFTVYVVVPWIERLYAALS